RPLTHTEVQKAKAIDKDLPPVVALERCFALKGGTAINLFVRDFPHLSVDIDLAYIPLESRDVAWPNWSLAPEDQIQHLPAVKWKLQNIGRIPKDKHIQAVAKLEAVLAEWIK
ncbi:nucleotidyl transferase AbiEii/AbiGii toxin family protein, partial [Yersinia ruckeri]|nr:nucleotidyl transferase AbiEii/AbiGii toxin family protein [Yersinia ruckeri]